MDKLLDKIILNSYYPPIANNYFVMFNAELATKITEQGKQVTKLLNSKINVLNNK